MYMTFQIYKSLPVSWMYMIFLALLCVNTCLNINKNSYLIKLFQNRLQDIIPL